jgi:hypothetical protein
MKTKTPKTVLVICAAFSLVMLKAGAAVIFSEDFEADLSRWTGQAGGAHHGVIVPDPLGSGRGNVLSFTALVSGGDIFTTTRFVLQGTVAISFDYLGLRCTNTLNGAAGGFFGISGDDFYVPALPDCSWKAGTPDAYDPCSDFVHLTYDGTWRHYRLILSGESVGPFHLALEDDPEAGATAGDAFFDNITIETVPAEPATLSIATYAGILITGTTGAIYRVEYATALPATSWTAITNVVLPRSPYLFFDAQPITDTAKRFYRVVGVQ